MVRRVCTFPPFIVLAFSVIWFLLWGHTHPESLNFIIPAADKIAATLVPLALFSVGFQLRFDLKLFKQRWVPLTLGLAFKLIMIPLIFILLYIKVLNGHDLVTHVTVLESAMASMITSAVVAAEFNLDSEIANLMVGVSIILSLFSVPLWNLFLAQFFQ